MCTAHMDPRELRLARNALGYLEVPLDPGLEIEAAQEVAPETQHTGEPLPDVRGLIAAVRNKLTAARSETDGGQGARR